MNKTGRDVMDEAHSIGKTLLVEDLPASQQWLSDMLTTAFPHVDVRLAANLAQARSQLEGFVPDLALIDLGLPDGSGVQLIRALSGAYPDCLCVVSTIFDDDQHLFPALNAGAQGYLLKDQPAEEQITLLRGIAAGRPPLSPEIAARLLEVFRGERPSPGETGLSPREAEVLSLISKGYAINRVGDALAISHNTVATHVKNIYRKLKISSRAEACAEAIRLGLLSPQA